MNRTNLILTLGAALVLAPITSMFAQSPWQMVDNLAHSRGRDIVADSAGNFISLAIDDSTVTPGPVWTAVSRSGDGGATWRTVGTIGGYALDLAVAPDGALFASGNRSTTVSGRAFVWQSLDHGASWSVFDPSVGLSTPMLVSDVAAGNSGAIYVCGSTGLIRKGQRTQSGITWTTVDFFGAQPQSIWVRPGTAAQPDEVLVCGSGWTVRRSVNGGATWTTVDSYSAAKGGAYGVTTGPDDSIYVVGRMATTTYITNRTVVRKKVVVTVTTSTEYGGLVRKSSNGGASWANVDYVANANPSWSITADAFGGVFTTGTGNYGTASPNWTWLVRGSADGGATWVTTDSFLPDGATQAQAFGVASDATGNVCVVGELTTGTVKTAPIRRLAAP